MGKLRDATAADAEAILDLVLLSDLAEIGESDTSIEEVRTDLATDDLRSAVIEDPAGELLGYVWVEHHPGHQKVWGDLVVRPGAPDAVGPVLLGWLRRASKDIDPALPTHVFAGKKNLIKRRLYEAAGGEIIRRSYRMEISFEDSTTFDIPPLADGVEIRRMTDSETDLRAMHAVVDVAFLDHFGHESEDYDRWRKHSVEGVNQDLSLWWLATVDGIPAAGLYGTNLPGKGYIDTLGTLREFRGKGIARALLLTSFAEFHRRGQHRVMLTVDSTNPTGALALYESAGMTVTDEGIRYELVAS